MSERAPDRGFRSAAPALATLLAAVIALADLLTPASVNVAALYAVVLAALAAARNRFLLWAATVFLVAL